MLFWLALLADLLRLGPVGLLAGLVSMARDLVDRGQVLVSVAPARAHGHYVIDIIGTYLTT